MKKTLMIVLTLCLLLSLCACGGEKEPAPVEEPVVEAPVEEAPVEEPPVEKEPVEEAPSALELAESCVGKDISELYALIGEPPQGSSYVQGCLHPNDPDAQEGELYYDGFIVYTDKTAERELVYTVLAD